MGDVGLMQEIYRFHRDNCRALLPTSRRKKENFLEKVRERVDYYKPRIEERCRVSLGNVKVKDNKIWLSDHVYDRAWNQAIEVAWDEGRIPTKKDFYGSFATFSILEALMIGPIGLFNVVRGADFRQHNNIIYTPFNLANRIMDVGFEERAKRLDYGVVHELSHVLWKKILGRDEGGYFGEGRKWFEGFATYCADCHFEDFYPVGTKKMTDLLKVYSDGKKRIGGRLQNMVRKFF
ncbi:MAG: hypothetical protein KKF50_00200 [Nanoarchaeota archaeon]|nr:hypothetical protein [Nanoarchaeota archaeon]